MQLNDIKTKNEQSGTNGFLNNFFAWFLSIPCFINAFTEILASNSHFFANTLLGLAGLIIFPPAAKRISEKFFHLKKVPYNYFWIIFFLLISISFSLTDIKPNHSKNIRSSSSSSNLEKEKKESTYKYDGPKYKILYTKNNVGATKLNKVWIFTGKFDYSNDQFKKHIKKILTDVARHRKSIRFMASIATDREVLLYDYDSFQIIDQKTMDYVKKNVLPKNASNWVASYTGGYDYDDLKPSDSSEAYTIQWFGNAFTNNKKVGKFIGTETWKPIL